MTATCPYHTQVLDKRGAYAVHLPVPKCEPGSEYMVWTENDGGAMTSFGCSMAAANFAAEEMAEDEDNIGDLSIRRQCHEHQSQPYGDCAECDADDENEDDEDEQDDDEDQA